MTLAIRSPSESSATTINSTDEARLAVVGHYEVQSSTTAVPCTVIQVDLGRPREEILPNHVSIEDIETELLKIEGMGSQLEQARSWVADTLYPEQITLRVLRLRKGFTQTQLARKLGTSQPHLARIEKGQGNIMRETMHRLCDVLGVDMNTLDAAIAASHEA